MTSSVCENCGAERDASDGTCPTCDRTTKPARQPRGDAPRVARASASPSPSPSPSPVPGDEHASRDPDDLSGTILGAYRLVEQIGVGGIGHVYRAEHVRLARQVAIKRLRPEYAALPSVVQRFFAEARAANQIAHENIVEITDFVENDPAGTYLIMELLKGIDLGGLIDRELILPLDRSVRILVQVARALRAAHAAGIVHRDLKPDNIFLIERAGVQDFVKLLDFGVAKLTQHNLEDPAVSHRTAAGSVLGTPAYMAPEQASGQPTDHRIDIYAMGVIMYELSTGRPPFTGTNLGEFIVKHSTTKPVRPSKVKGLPHTIPDGLEKLILRCLAKSREDRPQSMEEIESELVSIAETEGWPLEAFAHSQVARPRLRPLPPTRWPLFAAFSVFALGAGALAFALVKGSYLELGAGAGTDAPRAGRGYTTAAAPDRDVTLRFDSLPAGAEVWREGGEQPIGITPFELALPRVGAGDAAFTSFEFRHPGYRPARYSVSLAEDGAVVASLGIAEDTIDTGDTGDSGDGGRGGDDETGTHRDRSHHGHGSATSVPNPATSEIDRSAVIDPFNSMRTP